MLCQAGGMLLRAVTGSQTLTAAVVAEGCSGIAAHRSSLAGLALAAHVAAAHALPWLQAPVLRAGVA
jgi:hypothetical protein